MRGRTTGDVVSGSLQVKARGNLWRGHTREINCRFCSCILTRFLLLERKEVGLERCLVYLSVKDDVCSWFCSWFLSRAHVIWGAAEEAGEAHPGEHLTLYNFLTGGWGQFGVSPFSQVKSNRLRRSGLKLYQGRLDWMLLKISSLKELSSPGTGCWKQWWSHHPWMYLKDV